MLARAIFAVTATLSLPVLAQPANPGWIADAKTGCRVANPKPIPSESISWSGACRSGMADGPGVLRWFVEGKLYDRKEGQFRAGRMNGQGKASFGGMTYAGGWRDGVYDGQGTFTWPNGDRYVGEFRDGELSGRGVLTSTDGNRYEGEWRHSMREGPGVEVYADGNRYEGEWRNDKPDGRGRATFGNGRIYDGSWSNGCFRQGSVLAALGTSWQACGFK